MQANYGPNELNSILQKVRTINIAIGTYEMFAITNSFDYAVKLSNGRIVIKIEELQDDERNALTSDRLDEISKRFQPTAIKQEKAAQPSAAVKAKPKKRRVGVVIALSIIGIILVLQVVAWTFSSYDSSNRGYSEQVRSLKDIEKSQPAKFLSASGTYTENFWGDKYKVKCKVSNRATAASYKDAVVQVTYFSKTNTVLHRNNYTIYEVFTPNSSKTVKLKIDTYRDVNSIGWKVLSAKAY